MCVNCAAAGSSYVVGAAAAAKAVGPKGLLDYVIPVWLRPSYYRRTPRPVRPAVATPRARREWLVYTLALAVYVASGVAWPRLLDPVLGPLFLIVAIHVVPARVRRWRASRALVHAVAVDAELAA